MWIIVVEMLVALGLAVFIVWWTMFYKPKPKPSASEEGTPEDKPPAQP